MSVSEDDYASEDDHASGDAWRIRRAFMDIRVDEKLLNLVKSDEFSRKAECMKDALILIRNLSFAGSDACERLLEGGALNWLLEVLERHENSLPIHTSLAMKALGKFLNDPAGILAFLKGGVKSLVAILKDDYSERGLGVYTEPGLSNFLISIPTAVAKESPYRLAVCHAMFECELHRVLNAIIEDRKSSTIRDGARSLMQLLIEYGPTSRISDDLSEWGCLESVFIVKTVKLDNRIAKRLERILDSRFMKALVSDSDDEGESS